MFDLQGRVFQAQFAGNISFVLDLCYCRCFGCGLQLQFITLFCCFICPASCSNMVSGSLFEFWYPNSPGKTWPGLFERRITLSTGSIILTDLSTGFCPVVRSLNNWGLENNIKCLKTFNSKLISNRSYLLNYVHFFFVFLRVSLQQWSGGRPVVSRKCSVHGKSLCGYPCCFLSLTKKEYSQS